MQDAASIKKLRQAMEHNLVCGNDDAQLFEIRPG
jgi:hypothetical protein